MADQLQDGRKQIWRVWELSETHLPFVVIVKFCMKIVNFIKQFVE